MSRRLLGVALACAMGVLSATAVSAQTDPPGPYVIDLRGAMCELPSEAPFYPTLAKNTFAPGRGFGAEVGGHIYLMRLGPARLGVGGSVTWVRGTSPPPKPAAVSAGVVGTPAPAAPPSIHATFRAIAPQVSFNFGHASGWSYLSGGVGASEITSVAIQASSPGESQLTGYIRTVNIGGGARWFLKSRLGIGFDVRFHKVAHAIATPNVTLISASVGLSVK